MAKICVLADLHLGHRRLPGEMVYRHLVDMIYPQIAESDMLILAGDTFHTLLDFGHATARYVVTLFNELYSLAIEHHCKIRILRGTFSHDRAQVEYLQHAADSFTVQERLDVLTYSSIALAEETIGRETIRILYLPDDLPYKSESEVLDYVRELLDSRGWEYVDLVIGHGYMAHVLPVMSHGPRVVYTVESLSTICRHLAVFGHVHTPSVKRYKGLTALYVGSFERMAHSEEEDKGYVTIDTTDWSVTRHIHRETLLYLTYTTSLSQIESIVADFTRWLDSKELPTDRVSYIRVKHPDSSVRRILGEVCKERVSTPIVYTAETTKTTQIVDTATLVTSMSDIVIPTEANVVDLIYTTIRERGLLPLSRERIRELWDSDGDLL